MEGNKPTKVTIEDLEEYNLIVLKEFGSEEEGFRFYNSYAEGKGFSVRKDIVKRDPTTGRIVRRRYYCSREGYRRIQFFDLPNRQKEPRPLTRCGCEAEFEIELNEETGRWFVKNFKDEHKHSLARPGEVAFLRSHRGLSDAQKADAIEFQVGGIRKYQIMEVMEKQHGGYEKVGFIPADLYNFFKRYKKRTIIGYDAEIVISHMRARQEKDSEFFYQYNTDDSGHLRNLFWSDAQSRIDYDVFGDVVVFDSTYRVNRYNLPFVPFIGVNHHRSTIVFGCGVVSDESTGSYEWLLHAFLKAMYQKEPRSLITDGDAAMRQAIRTVMPRSEHRLCTWHIEQNMIRHLRQPMLSEFRTFIYAPMSVDNFEKNWNLFKQRHEISDENKWMCKMYELRKMWAAAYLQGKYYLGMKSNQRSESLNSRLHRHLDRKMTLYDLVDHYEHCLSRMRRNEAELDSRALQSIPFTKLDAEQLEKSASVLYTPNIFKLVKVQIENTKRWSIGDIIYLGECVKFFVVLKESVHNGVYVDCRFEGNCVSSITCSCRKMECESIPCEHIFVVLKHIGVNCIPQCCVLRRWTMGAKVAFPSDRRGGMHVWSDQMDHYRELCNKGKEAFLIASRNEEMLVEVLNYLQHIIDNNDDSNSFKEAMQYSPTIAQGSNCIQSSVEIVHDPVCVNPRGAPRKRYKNFTEKTSIHCGYCGKPNHTRRTCPLLQRDN